MLLNTLSIFHKVVNQINEDDSSDNNNEIDRLYNSSPIIMDTSDTYVINDTFMNDDEGTDSKEETPTKEFIEPKIIEENKEDLFKPVVVPKINRVRHENDNIPNNKLRKTVTVERLNNKKGSEPSDRKISYPDSDEDSDADSESRAQMRTFSVSSDDSVADNNEKISGLTLLLAAAAINSTDELAIPEGEGIELTIYLPDFTPMNLHMNMNDNFRNVVEKTLKLHKNKGLQPALHYSNPDVYELRLHEGDGEPDRDFPALALENKLVDFNFDEYCLCTVGNAAESLSFSGMSFTGNDSSSNSTPDHSKPKGRSKARGSRYSVSDDAARLDSVFSPNNSTWEGDVKGDIDALRDAREAAQDTRAKGAPPPMPVLSSTPSSGHGDHRSEYSDSIDHSLEALMGNSVSIIFPNGEKLETYYNTNMKMIDLLPLIHQTQRLRLYTNEYIFHVSPSDQKRLKLMSPQIDMQSPIQDAVDVGVTSFEIHNKIYADCGKTIKNNNTANKKITYEVTDKIHFTDATANAYQEWNVIKKNKFGRKQERIFGVDGKKIYNAKRGQLRGGNQSKVQRAERNITSIVNIDVMGSDKKTFRITWMDNNDLYNIEYTCDTINECAEIVAKVKYTLNRNLNR